MSTNFETILTRLDSLDLPWINSLGIPFRRIPGHEVLLAIWPVRVRDFRDYCAATGREFPAVDFEQTPDDPVAGVSWTEATDFCRWLTGRDREGGCIDGSVEFRLPFDREWSAAVGLLSESGRTPAERSGRARGYPWGSDFPPPAGGGNYQAKLGVDAFRETSPVGSFPANRAGFHDLGGNVWEWCQDFYERDGERRVLRGASCFNDDEEFLKASYRDRFAPGERRNNNGFRIALGSLVRRDPWV